MPEISHPDAGAGRSASLPSSAPWSRREIAAEVLSWSGSLALFRNISRKFELAGSGLRRVSQSKYLILCYHRVGTEGIPYYCTLPVAQFEMQMRYLRKHCRLLSMEELAAEIQNPPAKPTQAVAVTFDDGYSDLLSYALPILKKYEIPATIYLTADCIETGEVAWYDRVFLALQIAQGSSIELPSVEGAPIRLPLGSVQQRIASGVELVFRLGKMTVPARNAVCQQLEQQVPLPPDKLSGRMLSWDQVRHMRAAGIFFGAHTLSHPFLSQLAPLDVERELRASRAILEERLGEHVLDVAFPFGRPEDCGPFAYEAAARCGFRTAVTTAFGCNTPGANMHALRRVQLGDERTAASFALQLHRAFFRPADAPLSAVPLLQPAGETHAASGVLAAR